jgi:hypothetical protein
VSIMKFELRFYIPETAFFKWEEIGGNNIVRSSIIHSVLHLLIRMM